MLSEKKKLNKVAKWYSSKQGFYSYLVELGFKTLSPFILFNGSTLEIGSADGQMTKFIYPKCKKLTVIEPSEKFAEIIKHDYPRTVVHQCLLEEFNTKLKFDNVFMAHLLEHLLDSVSALKKVKKILNKKGRILIIVPNANSLHRQIGVEMGLLREMDSLNPLDKRLGHKRVYNFETLQRDIKKVGLEIISIGGIFLKPLSNDQLENFPKELIDALYEVGKKYPKICSVIYAVCTNKH